VITTRKLTDLGIQAKSRTLFVMPHPDDETVFVGGLLHHLSQMQIPTRVITMCKGEKSTLRHGLHPSVDLGNARKKELFRAFQILGITNFTILDFPDSALEHNEKQIVATIKKDIQQFKPTHVITLEPDGIYGHPDHIAISRFTRLAVNKPIQLLWATVSPHYVLPSAKHMAKRKNIHPVAPDIKLKLSGSDITAKLKSFRAHASQFPLSLKKTPRDLLFFLANQILTNEFYAFGN